MANLFLRESTPIYPLSHFSGAEAAMGRNSVILCKATQLIRLITVLHSSYLIIIKFSKNYNQDYNSMISRE